MNGVTGTSVNPYSDFVSALNDITQRWETVSPNRPTGESRSYSVTRDVEVKAVNDFMSGKVPQKGSNVVELVSKMVF